MGQRRSWLSAAAALVAALPLQTLAQECAEVYGQCGGQAWRGPTCCLPGSACVIEEAAVAGSYGEGSVGGAYAFAGGAYSRCLPEPSADPITDPEEIDVLRITLADTLAGLRAGVFTSETLTKAFLAQIAKYEPLYNAFTFLNPFALSQVPLVIKEALDVYGFPSTFGWDKTSFLAGGVDLFPARNAATVQLLLDEGAVILGKTNIPPFSSGPSDANASWAGPTLNGANPAFKPGTSSTGTGTAVAAGFAVWGMAEETGGSIQLPADAQSLVGLKTTFGVVNVQGLAPLSRNGLDVLGPITRTVRDAAIAYDVLSRFGTPEFKGRAPAGGYTSLLGKVTLEGKRIGLFGPGWSTTPEDVVPEVKALYAAALQDIEALGATLVPDPFAPGTFSDALDVSPLALSAAGFDFSQYLKASFGIESFDEFVAIAGANPATPDGALGFVYDALVKGPDGEPDPSIVPDLAPFRAAQARYLRSFAEAFDRLELDALVFPTLRILQPPITEEGRPPNVLTATPEINIMGVPVVTVPTTRLPGPPRPASLAFIGRKFDEAKLLALAYDYEQATQLRIVPDLP